MIYDDSVPLPCIIYVLLCMLQLTTHCTHFLLTTRLSGFPCICRLLFTVAFVGGGGHSERWSSITVNDTLAIESQGLALMTDVLNKVSTNRASGVRALGDKV